MLLRFGKLYCLGDDLMLVDNLAQQAQLEPSLIQQWSRRTQGVGFRRLVVVDIPRDPAADFDCRSFDRNGSEVDSCFADLCCAARFLHDKRLTNQPGLRLQTAGGCVDIHMRDDGWVSASYGNIGLLGTDALPEELERYLQQLAQRHALTLDWQAHGRQLLVWADQAPPQRLHRLLQPVARKLRGWQLLWLYAHEEHIRVQGWQADAEPAGHDPVWLIASMVQQNWPQQAVQVEWQQDCLLLEFSPQQDSVQLCARAWPAYEGQIRL